MIQIAPSLLAADFIRLGEDIKRVEIGGADLLHLDIMDGHMVPNITFGPPLVKAVRKATSLFLEAHLMISNPDVFIRPFAAAGADRIIIHAEATPNFPDLLNTIRQLGLKAGVSIKPKTPLDLLLPHLNLVDEILFMTVEPGFGGQAFMPEVLPKIREGKNRIKASGFNIDIEVDGGIDPQTAPLAVDAGATILVAGTAIFGQSDAGLAIQALKHAGGNSPQSV